MTRLTDEQIRQTVAAMKTKPAYKAVLLERALGGEQEARFAVYALFLRQQRASLGVRS